MTKIHPHIIPEIEEWPIYKLSQSRSSFIKKMNEYTFRKLAGNCQSVEDVIASAIYLEKIRIKTNPWAVDPGNEIIYWKRLESELKNSAQSGHKEELHLDILKRIINRYSEEIVGHFNPKSFRFARKFLTAFFKRLLNTAAGRNHRRLWGNKFQLYDRLIVSGYVEELRNLMNQGIVVILPTHFSNLDSILVGYAIDAIVGLPSFSYGAGLNLYDVEVLAYFLNRLGAYKVDRRKKNSIYLENLKTFSTLSIQNGVNSIFFPGGTRSRSGALENEVKLGLLGTLIEAQRELLLKEEKKKIFIVPLIVSYHFVLEAKDLIEQHLQKTGKEKYFKGKSKDTNLRKIIKFLWKLFSAGSEISLSFAKPMDVFSNEVDWEGVSFDKKGKELDIADYFKVDGEIKKDLQREKIYTQHLGHRIVDSFHRFNVVLSSHLVAFVAFRILFEANHRLDIYSILNLPPKDFIIDFGKFERLTEKVLKELKKLALEQRVILSKELNLPMKELIHNGIVHLGVYHPEKPLIILDSGNIGSRELKILYYYHNRLTGYQLESKIFE